MLVCVRCGAKHSGWLHVHLSHGTCKRTETLLETADALLETADALCSDCSKEVCRAVTTAMAPISKDKQSRPAKAGSRGFLYCPNCGMDLRPDVNKKRHGAHCTFKRGQFVEKKRSRREDPNDFADAF
jgi:hypothetical protein